MNHEFISKNNEDKCLECGYPESKHGDNADCESCDNKGNLEPYLLGNSQALLCRDCRMREKATLEVAVAINTELENHGISPFGIPPEPELRVLQNNAIERPYHKAIAEARRIDEQLHLSSDIFTAKTKSIEELRQEIWADDTISADTKYFELVRVCKERVAHFQKVIFDLDKKKIEAYSEQKAWHIYMNQYANQLRADEKERLRIADITYDVKVPKTITPKAIKTSKTKETDAEIKAAINKFNEEMSIKPGEGMQVATVRMMMVAKNWTAEQVFNNLRRTLKENLSETE
jgi:hypothetical protein